MGSVILPGTIGTRRTPLASCLPNFSTEMATGGYAPTSDPLWRRNYVNCGVLYLNDASKLIATSLMWSPDSPHPKRREQYEVVTRNVDRARKRLASDQARRWAGNDSDIRGEEGNIAHASSHDELIPPVSNETLVAHSLFPALDPTWNIDKEGKTE